MIDFNALRLLLAVSVAFAHYRLISGEPIGWARGVSAIVAVQAFFVVSGWIVTASWRAGEGRPGALTGFYLRRLARLVPLYAVVIVAQALLVVALFGASAADLPEIARYLGANLAFLNFAQPGLLGFPDNPAMPAINPSLWTLKVELMFYASVPLWVWLARRFGAWGYAALFAASTLYVLALHPVSAELAKQLPGQLRFFVAGMVCERLFGDGRRLARHRVPALIVGVSGLGLAQTFAETLALAPLQPLFVAAAVCGAVCWLPNLRRWPDLSYGVYLLHAPVTQFAWQLGWLAPGGAGLALVMAISVGLSLLGCLVVERPAIDAGRRASQRLAAVFAARRSPAVAGTS